jgi:hypothetical protein
MKNKNLKGQSSFELLITLSFGLAILLPIVALAFVQIASSNTSLSSTESQQSASKIAEVVGLVGSEGPPAKQLTSISVPPGVQNIYIGNLSNGIGHEIIFTIISPSGISYITAYTPINVSGNIKGITLPGIYLLNITAQASCPFQKPVPCVYIVPAT